MPKPPRIAVVGSANIDLTTFTECLPKSGETILGEKFDLGFGGKGANQAVAARLCGAEVLMVGRVGNDLFGPAMLKNLTTLGVDVSGVRLIEGVSTGVAPIFVDRDGNNRIIVVKGANDHVTSDVIDEAESELRTVDCIVLQLEIPLETVYYTVKFAARHSIRCIVNPAPAQMLDMSRLGGLDYFIPNETEVATITGLPVHTVEDAKKCAMSLLAQGMKHVIVTLGANGSLLAGHDRMDHIPAFPMKTVDSTGAGDAFIGSFATFLGEGLPEWEAVRRANLYAALSTLGVGTQKSFYRREIFEAEWKARK